MRPVLFVLADKDMKETLLGLFGRDDWSSTLGCSAFDIDDRDLLVPPGQKDPGLFKRAHELARPFLRTHHHLMVLLDCAWEGAPDRTEIEQTIGENLQRNGWDRDRFEVVAIEPELEIWLWSDTKALRRAFECELATGDRSTLDAAIKELSWRRMDDPKMRLAHLRGRLRIPASSAQFRRFAASADLARCTDPAFCRLRDTLRRWSQR